MKRSAFFALLLLTLLTACATPTPPTVTPAPRLTSASPTQALTLVNDFEPPQGQPVPAAPRESPGEFRLLAATSSDGRTFQPTNQLILDQANVPDLIYGDNNLLYLYYMGWQVGNQQNAMGAALSPDFGQTWYFKTLTFADPRPCVDPDIVRLADGRFRLYCTTDLGGQKLGVVYVDSTDGLHFGKPTTAFEIDTSALDSTTFFFNNLWHLFVLDSDKPEQWHATSPDGQTFSLLEKTPFTINNDPYVVANGIAVEGGYRLYGFSVPAQNFRSFFSNDGLSWRTEETIPLAFDATSPLENGLIKDPAIINLPNGGYLMVYVTKIP